MSLLEKHKEKNPDTYDSWLKTIINIYNLTKEHGEEFVGGAGERKGAWISCQSSAATNFQTTEPPHGSSKLLQNFPILPTSNLFSNNPPVSGIN